MQYIAKGLIMLLCWKYTKQSQGDQFGREMMWLGPRWVTAEVVRGVVRFWAFFFKVETMGLTDSFTDREWERGVKDDSIFFDQNYWKVKLLLSEMRRL